MEASAVPKSLWRQSNFLKLWIGQAVSSFGSTITALALPLTAVVILRATPDQMGLLRAALSLPALLSLFFGVWVDHVRRRTLLILADTGRMLLLGSIPLIAWLGLLRIEYLYVIGLLVGVLTLLFDLSITSFLPSLILREQLVDGNSKTQQSDALISIVGPGAAGALIGLLTAPIAIVVDAISYLASVISLLLIRTSEVELKERPAQRSVWLEIGEGIQALWGTPILRDLTILSGLGSLFLSMQQTIFVLFVVRELKLTAFQLGLIFSTSGIAGLLGTLMVGRIVQRKGPGSTILLGQSLTALGTMLIALAGGSLSLILVLLIGGQALFSLGAPFYGIPQLSLRQAMTPTHLLGRVNASRRFLVFGIIPLGALISGLLGDRLGLRATLLISGIGMILALFWVFFSSIRHAREFPQTSEA
ncbi:MFS transporter [Ktedonospora formicarum]|uniref:MFS transporter n=1 Tax=Ktedonospora formicarum TaxID=2778364 RepID=A0A8J3HZK0_9CHLR|nr:MFS transporter [Ktedonospora formicarum]GHO46071.1 MFS transporter [Ktedonospora formicarum]